MARGQELLYLIEEGKYRDRYYMHHLEEDNTIILISDLHILSINKFNVLIEEWHVNIQDIRGLETDKRGILIHLANYISSSIFESPTHKRVIFVRPQNRHSFFVQLLEWLKILKRPAILQ